MREDETKLPPVRKVKTIAPVSVAIDVDGVDLKFDAIVVLEEHLPQRLYLGRQQLKCYNIGVQDVTEDARIVERASLVVAFGIPLKQPVPHFGMLQTGSGVSLISLSAFQKIANPHALSIQPLEGHLYATNGKSINPIGIAEDDSLLLGRCTLKTNFVVPADHTGAENFLHERNFLSMYNMLGDLTTMRLTIREPRAPGHFKAVHEVSNP